MLTTLDYVLSFFRNLDVTAPKAGVTADEINKWITIDQNYVLGKFKTIYRVIDAESTPLSAEIVGDIIALFVAERVDRVLNKYQDADKKPEWGRMAKYRLEEYIPAYDKDGKQGQPNILLPDAEYLGTDASRSNLSLSSRSEPVFRKGRDNW